MNPGKKKGLGRGLSALFGDSSPEEKTKITNQSNLVAIADLLPPAIAARFPGASPVSSATWMLNFLSEEREALDSGWFLLRSKAEHARGGYSSQDMAMYGAGGTPIAVGRQCVAIFDKPQPKELPFSPSSKL